MSYVTLQDNGGGEQDLEAQFRAFVLGVQPPVTEPTPASASSSTPEPTVADRKAVTRVASDQIARQASVNIRTGELLGASAAAAHAVGSDGDASRMHFTVQCFADHVLIFVTEDETCAPGVMVRYDPFHNGASTLLYEDEVPSVECTVLFGMRDHPLTNLIASTLAHSIRQFGETRPLLMGISVVKTARRLETPEQRKALLALVKKHVMRLASGS